MNAISQMLSQPVAISDRPLVVAAKPAKMKGRISVCHIVAGDAWAGAEVQVAGLLKYLARNPEMAVHAISLNDRRFAREIQAAAVDSCVIARKGKSLHEVVRQCSEFVRDRHVSIIHAHKYDSNIIAFLTARRANIPYLVRTAHGCTEPYSRLWQPKHWLALTLDRLCTAWGVDRVIAVSAQLANHYSKFAQRNGLIVIRNGVDRELVHSCLTAADAKQKLGLSTNHFLIGAVGRLEPVKRYDLFVAVATRVAHQIPNARFVVLGSGGRQKFLAQLVVESGLQEKLQLLGERQDVYDVLRAIDVLLICSDHEGLPTAMLEAMVLGVPVVARQVGGIPEVLEHRVNGLLVRSSDPDKLAEACIELYHFPRLRKHLSDNASLLVEPYSAELVAKKVARVYQCLMSQKA